MTQSALAIKNPNSGLGNDTSRNLVSAFLHFCDVCVRFRSLMVTLVLFAGILVPKGSNAQIEQVISQSQKLKEKGDYSAVVHLLTYSLDSLKGKEGADDDDQLKVLIALAETNRAALQFDLGLEYAYVGLTKANVSTNPELTAWLYNRMSAIHFEKHKNDSARFYANQSLNALEEVSRISSKFQWIAPSSALLLGAVERSTGNYKAALSSLDQLLKRVESDTSLNHQLPTIYFNYAITYEQLGNPEKAIEYAKKGYEYASEQESYPMIRQNCGVLMRMYAELDDFKEVVIWQERTYNAAAKIHWVNDIDALKNQISEYEFKDKQRKNQLLAADLRQKQTQIKWSIALIVVFLGLGLGIFLLYRRSQKVNVQLNFQNELIEKQRKELMVLDEAKSRFFANVSHELKTPLSLILGPLDQITHQQELPANLKGNFDLAYGNVNRLQELVNEILDLTKLDTNKLSLRKRPLYLKKFIYRIFYSFQSLAETKNQEMNLEGEIADDLCLNLDKDKYEKVISNLLSNAIKYSPEQTSIALRLEYTNQELKVVVTDDGVGMSDEDAGQIFERFFQGENKSKEGGLGIGLSLSKEYAQLMGGDIALKTEKGKGSEFTFTVQAEESEGALDEASVEILEHTSLLDRIGSHKNAVVLLVEDNHEMRAFIKSILSPIVKVIEAANGKKALELLERRAVDLVVSDIMMPEMDGFELLATAKQDTNWKSIPFIMITAKSDLESKLIALKDGVDDYIQKPFLASELIARVQNVLDNVALRRAEKPIIEDSPDIGSADDQLIERVKKKIIDNMHLDDFGVTLLADELAMSERTLYRSLKTSTGLTPNNFIKEVKLKRARTFLESESYRSVAEVAHASGF